MEKNKENMKQFIKMQILFVVEVRSAVREISNLPRVLYAKQ